jgi:hypothetical protein
MYTKCILILLITFRIPPVCLCLLLNSFFLCFLFIFPLVCILFRPYVSSRFSGKLRTSEEGADTIVWLATQPKEKMVSGAFYFDRAEAPKHLMLAATGGSHGVIDAIVGSLRSLSSLSSSS